MKIAFISVARHAIPPPIGIIDGIASISSDLAQGLQKKGHDITFFCPEGSSIQTKRIEIPYGSFEHLLPSHDLEQLSPVARAELLEPLNGALHLLLLESLKKEPFDIVHFHTSPLVFSLPFMTKIPIPKVCTLHDQFTPIYSRMVALFKTENTAFVSISNSQRKTASEIPFTQTIYHGIDLTQFPFIKQPTDAFLFCGRIHPVKGTDIAIQAVQATKQKLIIIGTLSLTHQEYYRLSIQPTIDNTSIFEREVNSRSALIGQFGQAKALLMPIQWEEPFGLVTIEAMACGTPVIAFAKGAMPEIIQDGKTGFLVNASGDDIRGDWVIKKTGIEGIQEAIERIAAMPTNDYATLRQTCRTHTATNFSLEKMTTAYEALYERISQQ